MSQVNAPPQFPKEKLDLLIDFYNVSDDKSATDKYANFFTDDADVVMGLKAFKGRDGIIGMRKAMWAAVATRKHTLQHVSTFGTNTDDIMLIGTVEYGLPNSSKKVTSQWAGHVKFTSDSKMSVYQVYMDSSPLLVAQGKTLSADSNGDLQIK